MAAPLLQRDRASLQYGDPGSGGGGQCTSDAGCSCDCTVAVDVETVGGVDRIPIPAGVRRALHRLKLSWKKARKLLGRADPDGREAFVEQIQTVLKGAAHDQHLLVYLDEAHIHQDADLGYGWSVRGERLWICSSSPGLSAKVSFYGVYLYNLGETEIWPYPRANGDYTIEVLERLRQRFPTRPINMVWEGAPYHRAAKVRQRADELAIELMPLPAYVPTSCQLKRCGAGCVRR